MLVLMLSITLTTGCNQSNSATNAKKDLAFVSVYSYIDTTNIRIQAWKHQFALYGTVLDGRKFYYKQVYSMFLDAGFSPSKAAIYAELPTIESGWDPLRVSPKGAIGLWQIMPETGKQLGLKPEELRDPRKSTKAAIAHITELELAFNGDPIKVLFSYNGGPAVVTSGMETYKTENAWLIMFPIRETYDFAPKVLSAVWWYDEQEQQKDLHASNGSLSSGDRQF